MKPLKVILIAAICAPLVLVSGIYIRNKLIGPVGWAEDNTLSALKQQVKNPGTLKILSSHFVRRGNASGREEIFMCGVVDAQNSYGAYTGGSRFASRSVSSASSGTFDTYEVKVESLEDLAAARSVNMLSSFVKVYWNDYCVDDTHSALTVQTQ